MDVLKEFHRARPDVPPLTESEANLLWASVTGQDQRRTSEPNESATLQVVADSTESTVRLADSGTASPPDTHISDRRWHRPTTLVAASIAALVITAGALLLARPTPDAASTPIPSAEPPNISTTMLDREFSPERVEGPAVYPVVGEAAGPDDFGSFSLASSTSRITAFIARDDGETLSDGLSVTLFLEPAEREPLPPETAAVEGVKQIVQVHGRTAEVWTEPFRVPVQHVRFQAEPVLEVAGVDALAFLQAASPDAIRVTQTESEPFYDLRVENLPVGYELIAQPFYEAAEQVGASIIVGINDTTEGDHVSVSQMNPLSSAGTYSETIRRVEVNGTPAWLIPSPGSRVMWEPSPGTYATSGGFDTTDELLEFAESVRFVDRATWQEFYNVPDPTFPGKDLTLVTAPPALAEAIVFANASETAGIADRFSLLLTATTGYDVREATNYVTDEDTSFALARAGSEELTQAVLEEIGLSEIPVRAMPVDPRIETEIPFADIAVLVVIGQDIDVPPVPDLTGLSVAIVHPLGNEAAAAAVIETLGQNGIAVGAVVESTVSAPETMVVPLRESEPASFILADLVGASGFDTWSPSIATIDLPDTITDVILIGDETRTIVGRLEISSIGVSTALIEGAGDEATPREPRPGLDPGSARVGEPGVAVIRSNRTTFGATFLCLDDLSVGDTIDIETEGGSFQYVVTRIDIVPHGTPIPETAQPTLALLSNHPRYTAREEVRVMATLSNSASANGVDTVAPMSAKCE